MNRFKKSYNTVTNDIPEQEAIQLQTELLRIRFLNQIEQITEKKNMSRKQLSQMIGVSPSYLTQLFTGNSKLNFETLGKVQYFLNVRFKIDMVSQEDLESKINSKRIYSDSKLDFTKSWYPRRHPKSHDFEQETSVVIPFASKIPA